MQRVAEREHSVDLHEEADEVIAAVVDRAGHLAALPVRRLTRLPALQTLQQRRLALALQRDRRQHGVVGGVLVLHLHSEHGEERIKGTASMGPRGGPERRDEIQSSVRTAAHCRLRLRLCSLLAC